MLAGEIVRVAEAHGRSRRERRAKGRRWRRQQSRALPSPDAAGGLARANYAFILHQGRRTFPVHSPQSRALRKRTGFPFGVEHCVVIRRGAHD